MITRRDIHKLKRFEKKLAKKLGYEISEMDMHFIDRVYRKYKKPTGEISPRTMSNRIFYGKSLTERKILEKEYHKRILIRKIRDAKELSRLHKVKY